MRTLLVTALSALLVGASLGGFLGYRMGWNSVESARADALTVAAESARLALQATQEIAQREQRRAVAAAEERGRRAAAAQGVIHEAAADPDRSCEWSDSQRMRIKTIYRAYGYHTGGADGMHADMPGAGAAGAASSGMGGGNGLALPELPRAAQ